MTKLTDMQLVLLSTAAARVDGSLLPPADSLGTRADRIRRSIEGLIKKGLAAEMEVTEPVRSWRQDGDTLFGVAISDAGRAATDADDRAPAPTPPAITEPPAAASRPASKISGVLELLRRDGGATLDEMVAVTGWLPHTTRAALTGLRKKGHAISKADRDGATAYSVAEAA